jgi:hypothetical protein
MLRGVGTKIQRNASRLGGAEGRAEEKAGNDRCVQVKTRRKQTAGKSDREAGPQTFKMGRVVQRNLRPRIMTKSQEARPTGRYGDEGASTRHREGPEGHQEVSREIEAHSKE